jgi:ATP-dependent exoDNAse (exonuclease V) beta subunit
MSRPGGQAADVAVRAQVVDSGRSFIVQAPAGSGKTELLMQRFLHLLCDPALREPEQVLAITFTRKAAAEMRSRIVQALEQAAAPAAELAPHQQRARELARRVLERDRLLGWHLLENPARLEVRTLDSLCEAIVRQAPLLEEFDATCAVTEDAAALYDEAARRTLLMLGGGEARLAGAVRTLLEHLDNNAGDFQRLVAVMLQRREQWLEVIGGRTHTLADEELERVRRELLEPALADSIRYELRLIRAAVDAALPPAVQEKLFDGMRHAAAEIRKVNEGSPLRALAGITSLPGEEPEDVASWRGVREFFFTHENELRKQLTVKQGFPTNDREIKNRCLEIFRELGETFTAAVGERLARLEKLPPAVYPEPQWEALRALFQLLPWAVAALKREFQNAGQVDFSEVAMAARAALAAGDNAPSDLAFRLSARMRHVLVDEFQDTSVSQIVFLERLLKTWEPQEGCTLFLVGDPMQSIYGWRDAEVTLFEEAKRNGIGRGEDPWRLESAALTVNFRSEPRLVEWFNRTFPCILQETNTVTGAVAYSRADAYAPAEAGAAAAGEAVEIHGFIGKQHEAEAGRVAELVAQSLAETESSTIAVLVRARTHLVEIARELKRRGIRFRAVKTDALGEKQAVRDVDALTRALEHLGDRTAWLAVLRAPWCELELADLAALGEDDHQTPIWQLMQERAARLSASGQARLARIVPVLAGALAARGRVPLRTLVESVWLSLGGLAALHAGAEGEAERRDVEAYLDLLAEIAVADALPEPARLQTKLGELYAPADTASEIRVELMTIHTAKGLEFDTVIVPGLGRRPRHDEAQLLYWRQRIVEGRQHLLLGALEPAGTGAKDGTVEGYLQQLQKDRTREENKRLLYVAATRARRKLHLLGHVKTPKPGAELAPEPNSLLQILWDVPEIRGAFAARPLPAAEEAEPQATAAVKLRRLPQSWRMTAPVSPVSWKAAARGAVEETHTFDWAGDRLRRIGTVTHAFLHRIAREGLATWNDAMLARRTVNIRAALLGAGLSPDDLDEAAEKVTTALGNLLHGERGRWLLAAHEEAQSELEITAVIAGEVRRLKVDRTFVENGVRWIVDYKVADRQGGDRSSFLAAQMEKYRPDLERYRQAMAALDARATRLALYFPLLNEFCELPDGAAD